MMSRLPTIAQLNTWPFGLLGAGMLAMASAALAPVAPTRPDPAAEPQIAMPVALAAPPADGYLAASPFDAARRPVDPNARFAPPMDTQVVAMAVPEAPIRLAGILVDGQAPRVLFAGETSWRGLGGAIGSWSVAAIDPALVTLRRGDETLTLQRVEALRP